MTALVTTNNDEFNNALVELEQTQKMCSQLMKTPHYAKLGEVGVFTIVQKARSVGLNPLDALNGAMYYVQGKVELTANTMNYMIRAKGHSVTQDPKSNDKICILHGKRVDNGDTMTCSFSIEDAKRAGIFRNQWDKYPDDMLFARALTRLARRLFPDVTKGCYVEGEIYQAIESEKEIRPPQNKEAEQVVTIETYIPKITPVQVVLLSSVLDECDPKYKKKVMKQLEEKYPPIKCLEDLTIDLYEKILKLAETSRDEHQRKMREYQAAKEGEVEVVNE